MVPLIIEENKSYRSQKSCYILVLLLYFKKEFSTNYDDKNYYKARDHCPYTGK